MSTYCTPGSQLGRITPSLQLHPVSSCCEQGTLRLRRTESAVQAHPATGLELDHGPDSCPCCRPVLMSSGRKEDTPQGFLPPRPGHGAAGASLQPAPGRPGARRARASGPAPPLQSGLGDGYAACAGTGPGGWQRVSRGHRLGAGCERQTDGMSPALTQVQAHILYTHMCTDPPNPHPQPACQVLRGP